MEEGHLHSARRGAWCSCRNPKSPLQSTSRSYTAMQLLIQAFRQSYQSATAPKLSARQAQPLALHAQPAFPANSNHPGCARELSSHSRALTRLRCVGSLFRFHHQSSQPIHQSIETGDLPSRAHKVRKHPAILPFASLPAPSILPAGPPESRYYVLHTCTMEIELFTLPAAEHHCPNTHRGSRCRTSRAPLPHSRRKPSTLLSSRLHRNLSSSGHLDNCRPRERLTLPIVRHFSRSVQKKRRVRGPPLVSRGRKVQGMSIACLRAQRSRLQCCMRLRDRTRA